MRPRKRVFHMARKSLQVSSSRCKVNEASLIQWVSQSVAKQAARARVSVGDLDCIRSVNCHMGDSSPESLFFFQRWSVSQFSLVVHGCFLSDERHVGGGGAVNGSTENSVVGIGGSRERFPCTAGEGVAAFFAAPNADRLAFDLLVLTNRTGVLPGPLGHGRACVSSYGYTVSGSESGRCTGFLGSLCQSVPLLFCYEFSKFHTTLLCHIEDLGKFRGREHPF